MDKTIDFYTLQFKIVDGNIYLTKCGGFGNGECHRFVEAQIAGENKDSHLGVKMVRSSEGARLRYLSHNQTEDMLVIVQQSALIQSKTTLQKIGGAVRVWTEYTNISDAEIVLEEVSAFVVEGLLGIENAADLCFTRFVQSHHYECQPKRASFADLGFNGSTGESQKRIAFANVGSWSTKEELPQAIVENAKTGECLFFQIESNASWYYELSDMLSKFYLYLGGGNSTFHGWAKALQPKQSYTTINAALAFGNSVGEALNQMTTYRRQIAGKNALDKHLPTIFNEYMHLSWDSPTAENTAIVAPIVAKTGVEYYVIDCGWHNEEPGNQIYPFVGQWKESKARFPEGVRKTTDFIRSLGMKAGLWIEPEIIGVQCQEMLDYYDEDCFMQRHGKRIAVMNRYFLDYRSQKVRTYMSETIRRMVEDYGADYIKCDYNQDCGVGTDYLSFCAGEGLEACADAFLSWMKEMIDKFPQVIFEGCSSGGMRMDYKTLSAYSLISTSDQTDYLKYPYIAGNILSAVIPEQAAVWSYPVGAGLIGLPFTESAEWVQENITADRIVMNMINSFLGRMHLASHLELLSKEQLLLISEGVAYYNRLTEPKKSALPYFPCGFTHFGAEQVVAGFTANGRAYLGVWCLSGATRVQAQVDERYTRATIAYPSSATAKASLTRGCLTVDFSATKQAVFIELS